VSSRSIYLMHSIKSFLKYLFNSCGYDVRKRTHPGLDSVWDIKQIYAGRQLKTIFDLGAHVGETACSYAENFQCASIHSFEPHPQTFCLLQANVRRFPNVNTLNVAVGEKEGTVALHVNQFSATNSLLPNVNELKEGAVAAAMRPVGKVTISLCSLDSYCRDQNVSFIDLLKMDVQGYELHVLRGARRLLAEGRIALIYSEVQFEALYEGQAYFQDVYAELMRHGIQLVDLYGHNRSLYSALRWCDALFVNPSAMKAGSEQNTGQPPPR